MIFLQRLVRRIFNPRYWPSRILFALLLFLSLDLIFPLPEEKPWSRLVLAEDGSLLSAFLSEDDKWRMKCRLDEVAPDLVQALIAKEDRWFWYHPGVNPLAIVRAGWSNLVTGKRTSGASTITMQLARMMEPKPRTVWGKIVEVFRAFQLEWHYSKTEILEQYLSYLPYGGNVEGVKAASYIYFNRPPEVLSLSQATLLTVVPNRPNSLRLDSRKDLAREARDKWLKRFRDDDVFPEDQVRAALEEPIETRRHQLVPKAPHLSRRVLAGTDATEIRTTISPEIQHRSEQLLAKYVGRARFKGISNGAVIVVDNSNASVRAYCGSADYFDEDAAGQVDGIQAIRSPGSTLKPAVYAMAFDKGILTPDSRLLDIPSTWNGYSPDNYDEKFRGPVDLAYALRHSLNITAVSTLMKVGFNDFVDLLESAGFRTIKRQRESLGLSVILGGCGTTLEELTRLFTAFARGGRMHSLRFDRSEPEGRGTRLFSEASAWLIGDILSGIERPDIPAKVIEATERPRIAWKTGTSYGRRDAWSIGFSPRYTVGVWIGNFDGRGVPDLSGSTMAVPLLFELFGMLEQGKARIKFPRPESIWKREICPESGDLPSEHCRHKAKGYYIRDVSAREVCDLERMLYVSRDSSIQYCTGCLPEKDYIKTSFSVYEPELTLWYESNDIPYRKPPVHNPECTATFDGPGPAIISPNPDYDYLIEEGSGQEILLQAASDTRVQRHYWYVNGRFWRSGVPGEKIFYPPKAGKLRVSCMDDKGRQAKVEIKVKTY